MAALKLKKREKWRLATKKTVPCKTLSQYCLWLYGKPGIGKTTLSDQFPGTYHFMFEEGAKALAIYATIVQSWPQFCDLSEEWAVSEFENCSVDVVELAYQMCFDHVCKRLGIEHPTDLEYGKGWDAIKKEFMPRMLALTKIPQKGCIFVSHATLGKRKMAEGGEEEDIHPALSGKTLEQFEGAMDVIGYYTHRRGQKVLQIRGDDNVTAKCRLTHNFRYEDGSPVKFVPMGDSEEEAYANLLAGFNNELLKPVKEEEKKRPKLTLKRRRTK